MKFSLSTLFTATLAVLSISVATSAISAENKAADLDDLLSKLANGQLTQTTQNKQREADFSQRINEQEALLKKAYKTRDNSIALSGQLESSFQDNEVELANRTEALDKRLG